MNFVIELLLTINIPDPTGSGSGSATLDIYTRLPVCFRHLAVAIWSFLDAVQLGKGSVHHHPHRVTGHSDPLMEFLRAALKDFL